MSYRLARGFGLVVFRWRKFVTYILITADGIYSHLFPPLFLLKKEQSFSSTQKKTNEAKIGSSEVEMKTTGAASKDCQPLLSKVTVTLGLHLVAISYILFILCIVR